MIGQQVHLLVSVVGHLVYQGANMMGIKLLCAQLEGASMRGCNFEDPAGSRANMEGGRYA